MKKLKVLLDFSRLGIGDKLVFYRNVLEKRYLSNGKVRLAHGNLSQIYNLANHIQGCQGNAYDCFTNKLSITLLFQK
ncbi:MAG: hypothetical protein WCG16_11520 [Methylococcales bacterium]